MKLVGATNWFVRGPFMLEGLICGLARLGDRDPVCSCAKEAALPAIDDRLDSSSGVEAWPFTWIAPSSSSSASWSAARLRPDDAPFPAGLASVASPPGAVAARRQKRPQPTPSGGARQQRHVPRHARAGAPASAPRSVEPETVVAHLGPTNSGKTHAALEFLAEQGRGVFAAPLRMLAQEAHRRLSAQLGDERVGLVTGEERVNEGAPIICCTAEMAPLRGEVLVLDEMQWADDEERGSAWTRLLLAGEYRHILLLGARRGAAARRRTPSPRPRSASSSASRRSTGSGERRLPARCAPGTVVVAFSRRAVLALAGELNRRHAGPRRRALRRDAARLAAGGDRPLPRPAGRLLRRDRRARPRRQPPVRDAALRRDDEVRRRRSGAISIRGRSPRSRAARAASGSSSAATSAC